MFVSNSASNRGGALAIKIIDNNFNISLQYCSFISNSANFGGALQAISSTFYHFIIGGLSINKSNLTCNKAAVHGGAIAIEGFNTTVRNSLFQGN